MKIKYSKEYEKLTPKASKETIDSMVEDMRIHGQRLPATQNQKGVLVDGYTRDKACKILGRKLKKKVKHFKTKADEIAYIISMNYKRKHFTPFQKIQMAIPVYKAEKKEAAKRKKKGTSASEDAKGKATAKAARTAEVSTSTFERGMYLDKHAPAKMRKKLERNQIAVKTAYLQLTRKKRNLPKIPLPKGVADVFSVDVPIGFKDKGGRGAAENHYPTMTAQELMADKPKSAKNAIMFFWMSPSIMFDTIIVKQKFIDLNQKRHYVFGVETPIYKAILDAWDFKVVKGEFSWNKDKIGVGAWNRNQHENLLIAIKGKMPIPARLYSSVINARRTSHSRKPQKVYEMIEKMYPKRTYRELYGTQKRKGWSVHGNQIT